MTTEAIHPGQVRAVVFDLFGTLVKSTRLTNPYRKLYSHLGLPEEEMKRTRLVAQKDNFASLADLGERLNPDSFLDYAALDREVEAEVASVTAFPETLAVLERLKKCKYKLGVISNLATPFKRAVVDTGIDKFVDEAVFSCDVGFVKPEPQIYLLMIAALGLDPHRIIMTGDQALKDAQTPRSLGMKGVHLDRTGKQPGSIATLDGIFRHL